MTETGLRPSDLPSSKPRRPRTLWVGAVVGIIAAAGLCVGLTVGLMTIIGGASEVSAEWRARLAKDYPGWGIAGFQVDKFSDEDGSETTYLFGLTPQGERYVVPICYVSENGRTAEPQDSVFLASGRWHDRSASLLEYLKQEYKPDGKALQLVTTEPDGIVIVEWQTTKRIAFFSSSVGDCDELHYDETSRAWLKR